MTPHDLQTWIWGFSAILLCRSSQALLGWMGTVCGQPFSGLFDWVQVRALAGSLKDIQNSPQPLLCCLNCVLRGIVLLEGGQKLASIILHFREFRESIVT